MSLALENAPELLLIVQGFELELVKGVLFPLKVGQVEAVLLRSTRLGFPGAQAGCRQWSEDSIMAQSCQDRVECRW